MSRRISTSSVAVLTLFFVISLMVLAPWQTAKAAGAGEQKDLVMKARVTLARFLDDDSMTSFRNNIDNARGVLIVPQMLKGAFFFGGSGGSGVLVALDEKTNKWSQPAFYTLGGISFGLQFGGQVSELILLVMSQKGIDSMLTTTVKLGGDASVAAGPVGRGVEGSTAPNLSADLLSFTKTKGVFAGVSVEGATVAARNAWNTAYLRKQRLSTSLSVGT